jgi:hypothetical protein
MYRAEQSLEKMGRGLQIPETKLQFTSCDLREV